MARDIKHFTQHEIIQRGRQGREIAPGLWSDPISERRNDYDGAQAGFEAAIAQTKSIVDTISSTSNDGQALDMIWDAALEVAATIASSVSGETINQTQRIIAREIRNQKKQR